MGCSRLDYFRVRTSQEELEKRKQFGEEFREIRFNRGLSIREMASLMGVSVEAAYRIENGYVSPETPNFLSRLKKIQGRKVLVIG